jgi:decaprenylphospho-beta-D-ribofuranose 2-oxidase
MITIHDLTGLNATSISSMPIIADQDEMKTYLTDHDDTEKLSIAGSRHSQGGQATCSNGAMLITELMNRITEVNTTDNTVTVEAGATWSDVHHHLNKFGLAPLVHQSSAGFSVGGSLSVNCHGRDARKGPLSSTVKSLELLLPNGDITTVTPADELCKAVLGGYGSCAVILEATLHVGRNDLLRQDAKLISLEDYQKKIVDRDNTSTWPDMHYAWLSFDPKKLYDEVLSVDYVNTLQSAASNEKLDIEKWATGEFTSKAWAVSRQSTDARSKLWQLVKAYYPGDHTIKSRMNWMRSAISFVLHKGADETDMLQEYFVPLRELLPFVKKLKSLYQETNAVSVLSTTLRIVQPEKTDHTTFLSYCPKESMVCVAVDLSVKVSGGVPDPSAIICFNKAARFAIAAGGSYYLPYYRAADRALFQEAYPNHASLTSAIAAHNPNRKLHNDFLSAYL